MSPLLVTTARLPIDTLRAQSPPNTGSTLAPRYSTTTPHLNAKIWVARLGLLAIADGPLLIVRG